MACLGTSVKVLVLSFFLISGVLQDSTGEHQLIETTLPLTTRLKVVLVQNELELKVYYLITSHMLKRRSKKVNRVTTTLDRYKHTHSRYIKNNKPISF